MARLSHHTEEARNYVGDNLKWGKSLSIESSVLFIDLYHVATHTKLHTTRIAY